MTIFTATKSKKKLAFDFLKNILLGILIALISSIIIEKTVHIIMLGLFVSLVLSAKTLLYYKYCTLKFTSENVILKYGILPHQKQKIPFNNISASTVQQFILHRLLRSGSLSIYLNNGTFYTIQNINIPVNVQDKLGEIINNSSKETTKILAKNEYKQSIKTLKILLVVLNTIISLISIAIISQSNLYQAISIVLCVVIFFALLSFFAIAIVLKSNESLLLTNTMVIRDSGWSDQIRLITYLKHCNKISIDQSHQIIFVHSFNYACIIPNFEQLTILETADLIKNNYPEIAIDYVMYPVT